MSVNQAALVDPCTTCRSCGSSELVTVLDLGPQPLANGFVDPTQTTPEARYPLRAVRCLGCTLMQLDTSVSPQKLFGEYLYASSVSRSIVEHAESLVATLLSRAAPGRPRQVIEIASNDGYLLSAYSRRGIAVLGIDPAQNLARLAEARGVPTVTALFDPALAATLRSQGHQADLLHAHNVLAHVPDPRAFLHGIALLLAPDGLATIEVPYVRDLVDHALFDTIYHEHLSYFSVTALVALFGGTGLRIADVERLPIHGGSLRLYVQHEGTTDHGSTSDRVQALLAEEQAWGVDQDAPYQRFAQRVDTLRQDLSRLLEQLNTDGARIAAYGASAKGTVLLNVLSLGPFIDVVADRSPLKQGLLVPGVRCQVVSPDYLLREQPAYVLLLCWNLRDEVLQQESLYRARGGRFIVPLPKLQVV